MKIRRCFWHKLNPFSWSPRQIWQVALGFLAIFLPVYVFLGLQPVSSAGASSYPELEIPEISLTTPVESLALTENRTLEAPATIAGSFALHDSTTLLIGHSSTIFASLEKLELGEKIVYNEQNYQIVKIETLPKSEVDMYELLAERDRQTLVLMTCAGESLGNQDYTERLIITAEIALN